MREESPWILQMSSSLSLLTSKDTEGSNHSDKALCKDTSLCPGWWQPPTLVSLDSKRKASGCGSQFSVSTATADCPCQSRSLRRAPGLQAQRRCWCGCFPHLLGGTQVYSLRRSKANKDEDFEFVGKTDKETVANILPIPFFCGRLKCLILIFAQCRQMLPFSLWFSIIFHF